jgi:hypothetical protein
VTNCQTFYVFLLPQTQFCNYRYCTLWLDNHSID